MIEIKSGAVCLLFSYAWVLCFLSPFWTLAPKRVFIHLFFNILSFSYMLHIFGMYCIRVRHRRRGYGAFWISVAICNIHLVIIKSALTKN